MGIMNKQWLKGDPERNRGVTLQGVTVTGSAKNDSWSKTHNVVFEINVQRAGGDYQDVYLTQNEIDKLLPVIVATGEQTVRLQAVMTPLSALPDADFIKFLAVLLAKRVNAESN